MVDNTTHTQFLKTFIVIKKHQILFQTSKKIRDKYIDIPKKYSIDWNNIPKKTPPEYWERVTIPVKIEKYIIKRNKRYAQQAHGTTCTI